MKEINQNPMICVDKGFYNYEVHKPFEEFRMDSKTVFPVVGFHTGRGENEKSFNYRIKDEKGTLRYVAADYIQIVNTEVIFMCMSDENVF